MTAKDSLVLGYYPDDPAGLNFRFSGQDSEIARPRALVKSLQQESDRGVAIVGAAYLEDLIKEILVEFAQDGPEMVKFLKQPNSSQVVDLCICFGLLSREEKIAVQSLYRIRNKFAHNIEASFCEPSIVDMCQQLSYVDFSQFEIIPPRHRFLGNVLHLLVELGDRPAFFAANPFPKIQIRRLLRSD